MPSAVQEYWIPPHIRACALECGAVLLDLKRNRYLGLGQRETAAWAALARNWQDVGISMSGASGSTAAGDLLRIGEAFVRAGLLSAVAPPDGFLRPPSIEGQAILYGVGYEVSGSARPNPVHVLRFARSCLWAFRVLRSQSLYSIAEEVSRRKERGKETFDRQRTIDLVCVFRRLRPLAFTAQDRCLFHALALTRFLSLYGIFATWMIGVRQRPWAAHSWVQHGDLVLDGSPEQIHEYTPIVAV